MARMAFEEGQRQWEDANNELELYKMQLEMVNQEEDPDEYNRINDEVRRVQM